MSHEIWRRLQVQLCYWVLVGELDAELAIVDFKNLNVDLDLTAFRGLLLLFFFLGCCSLGRCGRSDSRDKFEAQRRT